MPFKFPWWFTITDPKIKQAAIDSYSEQLADLSALMTTPDYIPFILDKDGNEVMWDQAAKDAVQAEIDALTAKKAALE